LLRCFSSKKEVPDCCRLGAGFKYGRRNSEAVNDGFAEAIMIGNGSEIVRLCESISFKKELYTIIESGNESAASQDAVSLVKSGQADIVMKGLVGTDKFLKAVMDKENGFDASWGNTNLRGSYGDSGIS